MGAWCRPPAPRLGPAFCVSPTLFSGLPALPPSPPTFPAQALGETFRGLQQTARLLGASDVGRVGGGPAGAGRGPGRLRTPRPPTPAPGTQPGRQRVAFTDGQGDQHGQMGEARPCLWSSRAPYCSVNKTQVLPRPTRPCAAAPAPPCAPPSVPRPYSAPATRASWRFP